MATLRERMNEGLEEQTAHEYEGKDKGSSFKSIFKEDAGLPLWKVTDDEHFVEHLPYFAGPNHPFVRRKRDPKPLGTNVLGLDIFAHRNVGVQKDHYICLAASYGLPCPICEYRNHLITTDSGSEKEIKALRPSRRYIFNIICLDSDKEVARGVQVWEVSQYRYHKPLMEAAKLPREGGYIIFQSPDNGKTVCFTAKNSGKFTFECTSFKFMDRESGPIPDEYLEQIFVIDEFLYIPEYDEVREVFQQGLAAGSIPSEEEGEGEGGSPAPLGRPSALGKSSGGLAPASKPAVPSAAKPAVPSAAKPAVPSAAKPAPAPAPAPAAAPAPKPTPAVKPTAKPTPPPPPPAEPDVPEEVTEECPFGGVFGTDWDKYNECDGCPMWDPCGTKNATDKGEVPPDPDPEPEQPKAPTPKAAPVPRRANK